MYTNENRGQKFIEKGKNPYKAAMKNKIKQAIFGPIIMFMCSCAFAIVFSAGGILIGPYGFDVATFVVFLTYTLSIKKTYPQRLFRWQALSIII